MAELERVKPIGRNWICGASGLTVCNGVISTNDPLPVADPGVVTVPYSIAAIQRHSLRYLCNLITPRPWISWPLIILVYRQLHTVSPPPCALLPCQYLLMPSSVTTTNHSLTWCQLEKLIVIFEVLGYVGRMWLTLEYVGVSERLFKMHCRWFGRVR